VLIPTSRIKYLTALFVTLVVTGIALIGTDSIPFLILAALAAGTFTGFITYEGEGDAYLAAAVSMFYVGLGSLIFVVLKLMMNPWTQLVASLLGRYWTQTPVVSLFYIVVGLLWLGLVCCVIPTVIGGCGGYAGMHIARSLNLGEREIEEEKMFHLEKGRILATLPESIERASTGALTLLSEFKRSYYTNILKLAVARIENQGSLTPEAMQWVLSYAFPSDALISRRILAESSAERQKKEFLSRLANRYGMSEHRFVDELSGELNAAYIRKYRRITDPAASPEVNTEGEERH